jgi:DNA-binding response OmpR family regulator
MQNFAKYTKNKFKPRVIICDQESTTNLKEYLQSVGFSADHARNGSECIELACQRYPDIILLDLDLPHMDGHLTMRHLRNLGIQVPVILFSTRSHAMPFDDDSAILQKPFKPKEIAIILETLLLETKKDRYFIPRRFKIH